MSTLTDLAPSGPVRRTKSHPLWVEGMVALYVQNKAQFDAEAMGADLLALVGEANIAYANVVLARYRAQKLTPEQAEVVADAKAAAVALSQVPAQRQYPAGVTA